MIRLRPLSKWTQPDGDPRRMSAFSAGWQSTLSLLQREADMLDDSSWQVEVVIELDVDERQISKAGGSLTHRNAPESSRVAVSFESRYGPLRYECWTYTDWRDNVRAVAMSLQALRAVTRWGMGARGEQYTGWAAIGTGRPMPAGQMTVDEAVRLLTAESGLRHVDDIRTAYRIAAKKHHPDNGGDPAMFRRLTEARDLLIGAST